MRQFICSGAVPGQEPKKTLSNVFETRDPGLEDRTVQPTYVTYLETINSPSLTRACQPKKNSLSNCPSTTFVPPSRTFRKKTRFSFNYSLLYSRMQQRIDIFQPIELDRGRGSTRLLPLLSSSLRLSRRISGHV